MNLRVVGAGLPRTGTTSLKFALDRLLDEPCYHMRELFVHPQHLLMWRDALKGLPTNFDRLLAGYAAGTDWPFSRFWRELAQANPNAIVLLSRRESPSLWYRSMDRTIFVGARVTAKDDGEVPPWTGEGLTADQQVAMDEMFSLLGGELFAAPDDREAAIAAYERHLDEVRAEIPAGRLLEWQPGDGWEPLCDALGVSVPNEPFPHENPAKR